MLDAGFLALGLGAAIRENHGFDPESQYYARLIFGENILLLILIANTESRWARDGVVTAVAAGAAVISAREQAGHQGSATVTVVASRRVHWVDASASNATNQLGTSALPFSRIPDAVGFAAAGDTVIVRSGRYEGRRRLGVAVGWRAARPTCED